MKFYYLLGVQIECFCFIFDMGVIGIMNQPMNGGCDQYQILIIVSSSTMLRDFMMTVDVVWRKLDTTDCTYSFLRRVQGQPVIIKFNRLGEDRVSHQMMEHPHVYPFQFFVNQRPALFRVGIDLTVH